MESPPPPGVFGSPNSSNSFSSFLSPLPSLSSAFLSSSFSSAFLSSALSSAFSSGFFSSALSSAFLSSAFSSGFLSSAFSSTFLSSAFLSSALSSFSSAPSTNEDRQMAANKHTTNNVLLQDGWNFAREANTMVQRGEIITGCKRGIFSLCCFGFEVLFFGVGGKWEFKGNPQSEGKALV